MRLVEVDRRPRRVHVLPLVLDGFVVVADDGGALTMLLELSNHDAAALRL